MNKVEFIEELKKRLEGLPSEEIENAINYYSEYFEDAGIDDETDVTISLGTAKEVAEQIILEYSLRNSEEIVKVNLSKDNENKYNEDEHNTKYFSNEEYNKKEKKSKLPIILIAILAVLASPLLLGLGIGAVATIFGLAVGLFAIVISIIFGGGACILGGIVCIIATLFAVAQSGVPTTILFIGLSLIIIGLGLMILWLSINGFKLLILACKKLIAKITKRSEKHE
ncbi:MAG: DUF1700 domain-containing protein [Clostridium sp.]|nr:DUF1700 domain-containing protein [Clostridium sp.]